MQLRNIGKATGITVGIAAGLVSGITLGLLFRWVEHRFGVGVYTLLLNIDFIPYVPERLAEQLEFALHLGVSLTIGIAYIAWLTGERGTRLRLPQLDRPWPAGLLFGSLPILLFIPLTLVSERTPAIDDFAALAWWIAGHVLYGVILGSFGALLKR